MTPKPNTPPPVGGSWPPAPAGSAFTYTLTYDTLQEIYKLSGMVSGWKMSLPTAMIKQAKKVDSLMLALKHISPNQVCCETCKDFEWADREIPMCRLRTIPVSPNAACKLHDPITKLGGCDKH